MDVDEGEEEGEEGGEPGSSSGTPVKRRGRPLTVGHGGAQSSSTPQRNQNQFTAGNASVSYNQPHQQAWLRQQLQQQQQQLQQQQQVYGVGRQHGLTLDPNTGMMVPSSSSSAGYEQSSGGGGLLDQSHGAKVRQTNAQDAHFSLTSRSHINIFHKTRVYFKSDTTISTYESRYGINAHLPFQDADRLPKITINLGAKVKSSHHHHHHHSKHKHKKKKKKKYLSDEEMDAAGSGDHDEDEEDVDDDDLGDDPDFTA